MTIELLRKGYWSPASGGTYAGQIGGISGRLTKLRLGSVTFYVRENMAGVDRFYTSSSARLGMKKGQKPKNSYDVLELCAPKEAWEEIAKAVREEDLKGGMDREVRHHLQFTAEWAEAMFERGIPI